MTDETLIADLIRNGVDPDLVQRVVSALISAAPTKPSKQDLRSERNRRYYENKRLKASENVLTSSETSELDASKTQPPPLSPSLPLSPQTPLSPAHPHTPAPARTREREAPEAALPGLEPPAKPSKGKGTQAELEAYAVELGLPATDGTAMFDHWTANGWKNGQVASKCWKAGMRNWQRNGWMPSQKGGQQRTGYRQTERNPAYTRERVMAKLKPGESPQDF